MVLPPGVEFSHWLVVTEFTRVVIPCKPSHPNVNMSLLFNDEQVIHFLFLFC